MTWWHAARIRLPQALWLSSCIPRAQAFRRACRQPLAQTEWEVLSAIVDANRQTAFGRQHGFARIGSVDDFCAAVPVASYGELAPWIERAAAGEPAVLTADPVRMFEVTSGTAGGSKLIPSTAGLQEAFNRALHPWMIDLFRHHPGLWGGPAYWVVSPRDLGRRTRGGIPIGFAEDSEYFGRWGQLLLAPMMAVPGWLGRAPSTEVWRYLSLLALLRADGLRFVSLWHPTFLPLLLSHLAELAEPLARDLDTGRMDGVAALLASAGDSAGSPTQPFPRCASGRGSDAARESEDPTHGERREGVLPRGNAPDDAEGFAGRVHTAFVAAARPDRARLLRELAPALRRHDIGGIGLRLWPRLALISLWTDGEAARCLGELGRWFPGVPQQGKGLLATEGTVTVPLAAAPDPVLTARSGFYEFQEGPSGDTPIRRANEVRAGERYRVIMTTPGGLYRYRLNDLVECRGFWRELPMFRFIRKVGLIGDLRGEKLDGELVTAVLDRLLPADHGGFVAPSLPPGEPEPPSAAHGAAGDGATTREGGGGNGRFRASTVGRGWRSLAAAGGAGSPRYVLWLPAPAPAVDLTELAEAIEGGLRDNVHYAWARDLAQLGPFTVVVTRLERPAFLAWRLRRRERAGAAASTVKFPLFEPG